jgi:hypothetical protein
VHHHAIRFFREFLILKEKELVHHEKLSGGESNNIGEDDKM